MIYVFDFGPCAISLHVDIKPTSCPNPFNTKAQGKLPVAVLGTDAFDVYDIDPATVMLEGVEALRYSYEDVATPYTGGGACGCHEEGPDGFMDLVLHFERQDIYATMCSVTDGEVLELTLTAVTHTGEDALGTDCVWIKHKVKDPPPPPRIFTRTFGSDGTEISLSLGAASEVSLVIYDVQGKSVRTLASGVMPAGNHTLVWDGRDDAGSSVADGVYLCQAKIGTSVETLKMLRIK
jgi:hypothetical protein